MCLFTTNFFPFIIIIIIISLVNKWVIKQRLEKELRKYVSDPTPWWTVKGQYSTETHMLDFTYGF